MKQQIRSTTLLCLLILLYAGRCYGEDLKVTGGSSPDDYEYTGEVLTIKSGTPITISGTTTAGRIVIAADVTANVTVDGVSIKPERPNENPAIDISRTATLNLTLKGKNTLQPGIATDKSALHVPTGATLVIQGEGELTAIGNGSCAGIGGNDGESAGIITIESGKITAKGDNRGAGIGGGWFGAAGNITIHGGTIDATGGGYNSNGGAGIGSGHDSSGNNGSITITGGNITATGGWGTACIGGGTQSPAGTITISGGVITALKTTVSEMYSGRIGGGDISITGGEITITGNPVIKTGAINTTNTTKGGGILFIGNDATKIKQGKVYGNTTAPDGYTVEEKETLTIPEGASLTVAEGSTLVNKGTIKTEGNGAITNNGAIHNTGTLPETINGKPAKKELKADMIATISDVVYIGIAITPTVSITDNDTPLKVDEDYTLACSDNINAGTAKATIAPKGDKYFGDPIEKTFTITEAPLTVTPEAGQFHYQDENNIYPVYTYSGNVNGETPGFTNNLEWGDDGYIKQGSLALADNITGKFKASNYTLTVVETAFTPIAEDIAKKEAALETEGGSSKVGEWYTGNVIIKAPTDFNIKQTGVTELRSTDDWTATSLTFDREGKYTVTYQLKRDGRDNPLAEKTVDINLDKSVPTIGQPVKGADGKSFSLEVGDAYSGIATIAYNLNSAGETTDNGFTQGDKSYTLSLTSLDYGTHSITVTVTDMAGHSTTDTRSIELKEPEQPEQPGKPENPDQPGVKPDPIYYTVTLPAVEGATTDPVAGEYQVESWSSFRFYLTLDSDYSQAEPVVTTDRGETLIPRTSDGAYIVKFVRDDVAISIDGIVKNPDPVANEELQTEGIRIYAGGGYLHIQTPKPEKVYIFTPDGRLKTILSVTDSGERIALPKGVYFVKAGERVYKTVL